MYKGKGGSLRQGEIIFSLKEKQAPYNTMPTIRA